MTAEKQQPRSTPSLEWLERQFHSYYRAAKTTCTTPREHIHNLASFILGNWLQVESDEVEMLVKAAQRAWHKAKVEYDRDPPYRWRSGEDVEPDECWAEFEALHDALAPFERP